MSTTEKEVTESHDIKHHQVSFTENTASMSLEDSPMNTVSDENPACDAEHHHEGCSFSEGESATHQAHRQQFELFTKELEKFPNADSKLQACIDFMEAALAQSGTPHFKSFWEARVIALQLFKENISPALRSTLWAKYNELSKEARRLKEILDEQSAFAVEQIEIAVKALEEDISSFEEHLQRAQAVQLDLPPRILSDRLSSYQRAQGELNLLNAQASRINALRKELIRTEMRIRQKNKFFQRLSLAGDKVFPRRKELIKTISQHFIEDVDLFIENHFKKSEFHDSLFTLREEIKALQNAAKILTLNTHSFTHTRMRLSECWDLIKNEEKERRKERAQQKVTFKQNFDDIFGKIQAFSQNYASQTMSMNEATKQLDEISSFMRNLELGRDEVRILREELIAARKPILDKQQADEKERLHHEQEREKQRRSKIQDVKQLIQDLLKDQDKVDAEALEAKRDHILQTVGSISLNKAEKQEIERQLKPVRDLISEKRESSLLQLSDDDRHSLQQLKEVLKQRKERRQEIKEQIDVSRKASGASGLDFEQAMTFNAQMAADKERLEKINQGIKEIEVKIAELEKKRKN